jgi:hypothetical protein
MKSFKPLFKVRLRLFALLLCLAAAIPQLMAQTYTVAGTPSSVLGTEWDPSNTSNDMVRMGSTTYYYLAKTANINSGSYQFKVCLNHGWGTSWPGSNYNYSVSSSGTQNIVYIFNTSDNAVSVFGPFKTLTVAGSQTELLGSSWGQANANNDMTTTDGVNYTLSFTDVNVTQGSYQCKVTQDHAWSTAWPSSNYNYSITFTGTADVVFSFNVITKEVNVTVTEKSVTPVTPTYYITGDNGLGLGGFKYNPTTTMTDEGNGIYTYSYNVTTAGNYYFAFADGPGNDWNDFNGNHRIGPTSGNVEVSLDGTWVNTQKGSGSYFVNVDAGPVTITLDVTNMRFNVVGTAPTITPDYYVVGSDTSIFPNGWNTGAQNLMTEDNGTYTWTANNVHLDKGTTYEFKVLGSDNSWHPSGNNATFSVDASGTYNVLFTFDGTNVTAVPALVQADPVYTYDIYVRYTGSEPVSNVFIYAWDAGGNLSAAWSGTALSSLSSEAINGHTYYKVSYTSYSSAINVIFNENGSSQTANLTANPGDNYFTYGGGNTVDGPNDAADAATVYYVVGENTSIFPNGWNTGSETLMTNDNGTYTWTASNVHLDAGTTYSYKVLGSDNSSHPSNDGATFSVDASGTYNVVFSFDGTNVTAVPTLVQADPVYTYDIYVRYTGSEPVSNVFIYAWDNNGTLSDAWNGDTGGTALSSLSSEVINGHTYYKVSYTSYSSTINVIFNENGSSQTADLTANPGDNYFTYNGGASVVGPTTEPDEEIPTVYYVKGDNTAIFPNGWNDGPETAMADEDEDGIYSWTTANDVHLNPGTYTYKVWGDDNTWYPNGDNATFDITRPGTYTVTVTFDSETGEVNAVPTLVTADRFFITGDAAMGICDWNPVPTSELTYDATTGYNTHQFTVSNSGTYRFVLSNGQAANDGDWADFNSNHRMGPQNGDQTISLNSDWITTQRSTSENDAYSIMLPAGTYTVIYDPATSKFKITGAEPIYITGDLGLGLGWSYAPNTVMAYDESSNTYSYTYRVPKQGTYNFVFANGQVHGVDNERDAWNTFNYHYRIGPTGNSSETYVVGTDDWKPTQMAHLGEDADAHSYSVKLPAGYVTIYYKNDAGNMQYKIVSDGTLGDDLYMVGGITCDSTIHYYAPNDGVLMKYDNSKKLYYLNHVTLNTNSTFCFISQLGDDWQSVGTRYGNNDTDTVYFVAEENGVTAHLRVTGDKINFNMPLGEWDDDKGEWQMNTAGIYNVVVNLEDGWVKLIKTDQFTLFPMNVYLQQTSNVEIDNVGTPGTTYKKEDFNGYWPLVAYNRLMGDWNPESDSCHYAVTYVGDTTTIDGKTWWHWQVSASIAEVMFTRTNQDPYQSAVIDRKAGVLWYTWEEDNTMTAHSREYFTSSATTLPGNVVVEEGHYYVYFINTVGWETVNCVAWSYSASPYYDGHGKDVQTWPGQTMTCIGIDPMTGYEVWEYDFGAIDDSRAPDDLLFHDGTPFATTDAKEQTGDFDFINGGVYDYLGLFDDAYTLNSLIRTAKKNIRYTISNDLLGVYYDADAETDITYELSNGSFTTERVFGALYAKDLNDYGEKSEMPKDDEFVDYVYDVCGAAGDDNRPSQIMDKEEEYDQSNWIKLVVSPNYDGGTPLPATHSNLADYVNHIIPGKTLQLYMTDSINPTGRVMAIQLGEAKSYNPNVYVAGHFNDTVVFNYTHREWQPDVYKGNYRTRARITWHQNSQGDAVYGEVTRERIDEDPAKMFYVAPKPQEIAYITWVVYDNSNEPWNEGDMHPYGDYVSGVYQPYTIEGIFLPKDPGRFYSPSNWDRSITINYSYLEQLYAEGKLTQAELQSLLTDGYLSENQLDNIAGGFGQQYGPYSNGYMQCGGIQVNWSLFDEVQSGNKAWWQIFRPGQAYKFKAIIRYARGSEGKDSADNYYYGPSNGGQEPGDGSVLSAPRREGAEQSYNPNMYFTGNYENLNKSKFIIFPIEASAAGSNGSNMGNVTDVEEIIQDLPSSRTITGVHYYNLTGMESDKPFDGINIVVTTYSDGSRSSMKILR